MSGCSSCGGGGNYEVKQTATPKVEEKVVNEGVRDYGVVPLMAGKSESDTRVKVRYYGGMSHTKSSGCRSCGGGGGRKYTAVTSERIMFASEDEPNGLFSLEVSLGHDYYVTEKQAEYLLTLTYQTAAGQTAHKFKVVD